MPGARLMRGFIPVSLRALYNGTVVDLRYATAPNAVVRRGR
jgi:hypothetical protein